MIRKITDRLEMMQEYSQELLNLHEKFYELLCKHDNDIDVPLIEGVERSLNKAYDEMKSRLDEIARENDRYYQAKDFFRAWELGLCPKVMKSEYPGDFYVWEEIAEYKQSNAVSQRDSLNAIHLWKTYKTKKAV